MSNLFAFCKIHDRPTVKRVSVTATVQSKIEGIFQAQAVSFLDGVTDEVDFAGDWKPDNDEILFIDLPEEATLLTGAVSANAMSYPEIDARNFLSESIKALFTSIEIAGTRQVLIQNFSANQILARRFSLMLDGNSFKELTDPAFTLDNYIVAIIQDGKLKFKSFHNIKRIFELNQFYSEATNEQLEAFCGNSHLHVDDVQAFKELADQNIRKMVHAIIKTGVLDSYPVEDIAEKAGSLGLDIAMKNGRIVVPNDRKSIKELLRFLDDGIYEAALTAKKYITNSKRPFG